MFVEILEGAAALASAYENRKTIRKALMRLQRLILRGNANVAVFGAGGTGKSTLGSFVEGELDSDKGGPAYQETINTVDFRIAGEMPGKLLVPPGQKARRPSNWSDLYVKVTSGSVSRVINVVCWGHHSTELERSRLFPGVDFQSDDDFRLKYLQDGRERELDALREILPHLKASPKRLHIITLVAKQDLWWTERHAVQGFYQTGAYQDLITELQLYKGNANVQHDLVSGAFVQQNLRTGDGFEIARTAAGYDDSLRAVNLTKVASTIQQMIAR